MLTLTGLVAACAHYPVNAPLADYEPNAGYRVRAAIGNLGNSPRVLVVMAFSGGGTRAAAFSYGVLETLADTVISFDGAARRLSDEIDVISAVSGGSFTAAYFALHRDGDFPRFEQEFLKRDVRGALLWRLLSPINLVRVASPYFGRSDLAAEYYDRVLFKGATYRDLLEGAGPAVVINATDVALGARFGFMQEQFDLMCADLTSVPVARAVAASSAVPMVLSPVSLKSYGHETCGYQPPPWVAEELRHARIGSRRHAEALRINAYVETPGEFYVHLADGGLSDNLGLRSPMERAVSAGGFGQLVSDSGFIDIRRAVFIAVNAQTSRNARWARAERVPGPLQVLDQASSVPLNRYNFETVELFRQQQSRWVQQLREVRCALPDAGPDCLDVDSHFIEVGFAQHPDAAERAYLAELPTSFNLSPDDVDRLRRAAREILLGSPEFQTLLEDLTGMDGRPVPPATR